MSLDNKIEGVFLVTVGWAVGILMTGITTHLIDVLKTPGLTPFTGGVLFATTILTWTLAFVCPITGTTIGGCKFQEDQEESP